MPEIAASVPVVRAVYFLSFLFGGAAYAVGFGLLAAGVSVTSFFFRLLPRWLVLFGMVVAVAGELSAFSLIASGEVVTGTGSQRRTAPGAPARSPPAPGASNRGILPQSEGGAQHVESVSRVSLWSRAPCKRSHSERIGCSRSRRFAKAVSPAAYKLSPAFLILRHPLLPAAWLVVTENNNRDYDDCLALLGVDGERAINEVIEAAASSNTADLSDHLLLLAGRFDRSGIFKAALENGSTGAEYNGQQVLVVKPFDREKYSMNAVRWLAILKNRVLVFGVPGMVARTLDRYERNEPADATLFSASRGCIPDVVPGASSLCRP